MDGSSTYRRRNWPCWNRCWGGREGEKGNEMTPKFLSCQRKGAVFTDALSIENRRMAFTSLVENFLQGAILWECSVSLQRPRCLWAHKRTSGNGKGRGAPETNNLSTLILQRDKESCDARPQNEGSPGLGLQNLSAQGLPPPHCLCCCVPLDRMTRVPPTAAPPTLFSRTLSTHHMPVKGLIL